MVGVVELGNTTSVKLHIDETLLDIRKIQEKISVFFIPLLTYVPITGWTWPEYYISSSAPPSSYSAPQVSPHYLPIH